MEKEYRERAPRPRQPLRRGTGTAPLCALAWILIGSTPALAQDLDTPRVTFRGFGTLGASVHDGEGIAYRRNVGQAHGIEAHEIGWHNDSMAGVQLNADLATQWDAAFQAVTREDAHGSWSPRITQAFLRYSPDESLVFRGGRFGYEIYLLAESRQVGYSYLAVRPAQEFYGLVTNDEVDGVDVAWTSRVGHGLVKARAFGGKGSDETVQADGSVWKGRSDVLGLTFDYTYRGFTARVATMQVAYGADAELRGLGELLIGTGAPGAVQIGAEMVDSKQRSRALQLGVAYDDGPLQAQVLYGRIRSDSIAGPQVSAVYGQLGYRIEAFTPFIAFAGSRDTQHMRGTDLPEVPELLPLIDTVRELQENMRTTQHTTSLGARWDFAPKWDLKLQTDFMHLHRTALNCDQRPPGSGPMNMTVVTATIDFVF